MTLTIDLTPEQQAALEAQAKACGLALPEFAKVRLLEHLPMSQSSVLTVEELESERKWDEAFAATSDEQFARMEQKFKDNIQNHGTTLFNLSRR